MKKFLIPVLSILTFNAYSANLESPLYFAEKGSVYFKATAELPNNDITDFAVGQEFGFGITRGIMFYQKLGISIGDNVYNQNQTLSDIVLGTKVRLINEDFKLDALVNYSADISKKYSSGIIQDYEATSFGGNDNNFFIGARGGQKIKDSLLIAGRIGYKYYLSDPEFGKTFKIDSSDVSAFMIGLEVAFQITDSISTNIAIDRIQAGNDDLNKTVFQLKFNYGFDNMMVSPYINYDAYSDENDVSFGARFGIEF